MLLHEIYMSRCLQLAELGRHNTAPNPMVGSVLVYNNRIIGEGYHEVYGKDHAEVNCIRSVREEDKALIEHSTLYVSLEPCAHFGKTPPCADLIIDNKIPEVVVGCRDPFVQVDGKGIEKLQQAGVNVIPGILEKDCMDINKRFFIFHTKHRPYITLKWAQTLDGKIGNEDHSRLFISNEYTNRLVHKWRTEEMAIMVGANTALYDNPELTNRFWPGKNPIKLVLDLRLRLPDNLRLFSSGTTIVFNLKKHTLPLEKISITDLQNTGVSFYQLTEDVSIVHQVANALYQMNIQSVLVEGGAMLLQSFIDEQVWDEAKVSTNEELQAGKGLPAPLLNNARLYHTEKVFSDSIRTYRPIKQ